MLLTILVAALLVICILVVVVFKVDLDCWIDGGIFMLLAIVTLSVVLLGLSITSIVVAATTDAEYEKAQYERNALIEQYEEGNQYAYDQIIEFDKNLYSMKYWGDNIWLSWLYNQRIIREVDYILYEDN